MKPEIRSSNFIIHLKLFFGFFILLATVNDGVGQTVIFTESMGNVSTTTTIAAHEAANGFDNDGYTFSGTADIRNTTPSSNYMGASGDANVFITNAVGRDFQISGISTIGFTSLELTFGAFKSTTASDLTELVLEYSTDGSTYTVIPFPAQPTGTGTAVWRLISNVNLPIGAVGQSNLHLRWRQNSTVPQFRIDDIILTGHLPCSAPTNHASSVTSLAVSTIGATLSWTNGDGAQRIVVMSAGNDIDSIPMDQTTYIADAAFGSGSEIGTGNFVVFKGSDNSVNVTNLTPGTVYYLKIFEFACSTGNELYYTSGTP